MFSFRWWALKKLFMSTIKDFSGPQILFVGLTCCDVIMGGGSSFLPKIHFQQILCTCKFLVNFRVCIQIWLKAAVRRKNCEIAVQESCGTKSMELIQSQ